jgi:hypothetical protein
LTSKTRTLIIFSPFCSVKKSALSRFWIHLSVFPDNLYIKIKLIVQAFQIYNYLLTEIISSPGPKSRVNYCHHLASVVCKLFTFQASSPKPLGRLVPNLAGMFLGWSSTKLLFFVPVGYSILLPGPIICSDWLKFQRSSSLKLMNWLNPDCKWMIIGMSFTKLLFLCRSQIQDGRHRRT